MARLSEAEKTLIWDWWQQGGSMRGVARELGRAHASVRTMIENYGGVHPVPRFRASRHLSLVEREEINRDNEALHPPCPPSTATIGRASLTWPLHLCGPKVIRH